MLGLGKKQSIPSSAEALPGRATPLRITDRHFVLQSKLLPPFPADCDMALFGLGCFWGAERKFWQLSGIYSTSVGYAAGITLNPSYEEVCSGMTGHTEVVRVVYHRAALNYRELLRVFWEAHNPTQGMRQGNDVGTQYRSGIYWYDDAQRVAAETSKNAYQQRLVTAGFPPITTELLPAPEFYYAEDYHQQYLAKNPGGYCGLGGTGVACG